jgi:L-malate glycosyltransferase
MIHGRRGQPALSDRRTRVLHVIKGLGPGGAERLLCSAVAAGDRRAFDYDVAYLLPWKNHLVGELTALGVRAHCLNTADVRDPRWLLRLHRLLRAGRYDVVHVHSPLVAALVRPLVRSAGRDRPRLVTTEHNGWAGFAPLTRRLNAATMGLDDAGFAVSREVLESMSPRRRHGVEVVTHGLPLAAVRALRAERGAVRAELGFAAEEIVVGIVANYRRQKAYPDLLAAARIVLDANPRVRFVAVGQGPLEQEVLREHARLGLGDRFTLLGYRPDAVRVLAGCDVFTLSSHWEGFPVALMEALALGVPVVATAVGGIPDGVTDGREGLLVPHGQPEKLAEALTRMASDDQLRAMAATAAARRGEDFDITHAVSRIEATYAHLMTGRRRVATEEPVTV